MGKKKEKKKNKDSKELDDSVELPQKQTVDVPIESLGSGIVSLLGEIVGGVVGLSKQTLYSVNKGIGIVKKKVKKSDG